MGRLSIWGAVVRVPVAGVEEPARVGRLRRDAAAELIRRLILFKFIGFPRRHRRENSITVF